MPPRKAIGESHRKCRRRKPSEKLGRKTQRQHVCRENMSGKHARKMPPWKFTLEMLPQIPSEKAIGETRLVNSADSMSVGKTCGWGPPWKFAPEMLPRNTIGASRRKNSAGKFADSMSVGKTCRGNAAGEVRHLKCCRETPSVQAPGKIRQEKSAGRMSSGKQRVKEIAAGEVRHLKCCREIPSEKAIGEIRQENPPGEYRRQNMPESRRWGKCSRKIYL